MYLGYQKIYLLTYHLTVDFDTANIYTMLVEIEVVWPRD